MQHVIPEIFQTQHNPLDKIISVQGNMGIHFRRNEGSERSRINLTQNLIAFGVEGEKHYHAFKDDLVLQENEAIFLKKGLYLTTEKVAKLERSFQSIAFFLTDDLLVNFLSKHGKYFMHAHTQAQSLDYFKFKRDPYFESYIKSLLTYFEDPEKFIEPIFLVKIEELLLNLVMNDHSNAFKSFLTHLNDDHSTSLEQFMLDNYCRNLSIDELAYLNGMSTSSFKRNFEKAFHTSPGKWIKTKRLEKAAFLLSSSNKDINEIAYAVGFESPSHFIHTFKSKYDLTPRKYKESISE